MPAYPTDLSHYDGLEQFCTNRQLDYLEAVRKHGSIYSAAKAMKVSTQVVWKAMQVVKRKAARNDVQQHAAGRLVPEGFKIKGTTTLIDESGNQRLQWVKTSEDRERTEQLVRAFVEAMTEEVRGVSKPISPPKLADSDLMTVYPMGDPHFGLYSWAKETGDDFDLQKAEALTCGAIDQLVATAPKSERALLLNLGDFFHADDSSNQTPQSGHSLDVDSRYAKVLQVGVKAMVYCIKRLLTKHQKLEVWMMPGNHDPHSSMALSLCLAAYFDREPRVTIDVSPSLYRYTEFGNVLIGSHHGHGAKMAELPGIMATDQPEAWGRTRHRYWYCGHIHHKHVDKEHPGCMVETFRTLAGKDAWHAGKGYRSGRDMQAITHHIRHGEIMRSRCDIGMLAGTA